MTRIVEAIHKAGANVVLRDGQLTLAGLTKIPHKKAKNILKLARENKLQLKIELKACAECQHNEKCRHDITESISFFREHFHMFHIVPKDGFYIVDGEERYKAESCELLILKELWASCPTRCRYCPYASTNKDGDWWCSRPAPGEEGHLIFRNLALLKGCPKGASSFRNRNR